jgi:hypothetical protein
MQSFEASPDAERHGGIARVDGIRMEKTSGPQTRSRPSAQCNTWRSPLLTKNEPMTFSMPWNEANIKILTAKDLLVG